MRIAQQLALLIGICTLSGLLIGSGLLRQTRELRELGDRAQDSELALRDLQELEVRIGHLLTCSDLVFSGGSSYLNEVVCEQALALRSEFDRMFGESEVGAGQAEHDSARAATATIVQCLQSGMSVGVRDRDERLESLYQRYEPASTKLVEAMDVLRGELRADVTRLRERYQDRQRRLQSLWWLGGSGHLLLTVLLWWWAVRRTIVPLKRLSAAAQRSSSTGEEFQMQPGGPLEVQQLTGSVLAFAADLREANVVLERANSAKSAFLANMSHELRTPMTAILGVVDMLELDDLDEEATHHHMKVLRSSGEHLLALVNDVLDLAKIEAGEMSVEQRPVQVREVLREVEALLRGRASGRGNQLIVEVDETVPEWVASDALRLKQVLVNLVGNAIKFTKDGCIRVHASWGGRDRLTMRVTDTGIGIPEERLDAIFAPFSQADESTTRRFGGTGLGLAISRQISELLGGSLHAESAEGEGSSFHLCVTAATAQGAPTERAQEAPERRERSGVALLVDDVRLNRVVVSAHLRRRGLQVEECENGQEALDAISTAEANGQAYDVVLMDMQMPVLDGYSAVTRLRERGYAGFVVALTAHAMAEDRQRCLDAGCDDYLTKPIEGSELDRVLGECDSRNARRAA